MGAKDIKQILETESAKPRIGKVKFYGVCEFCGKKIDISDKLTFNNKTNLIDNFGIEKTGNEWVCKYEMPLENCPFCSKTPF